MAKKKKEEVNVVYGLLSIVLGIIGIFMYAIVFGLLSIVLGAIGMVKSGRNKSVYIMSLIGFFIGLIDIITWGIMITSMLS